MGARLPATVTNTVANVVLAAATETVAVISNPISPVFDNAVVLLFFYIAFHTGTGTSAVFFRVRRGTTTGGVQLNSTTPGVIEAASSFGSVSGCYFDIPGVVAGQQWCVTLQQNGGTGTGTIDDACIIAVSL